MSFRACVVIGNRRGRVGYGVKKGKDVQLAVNKAVNQAMKYMMTVPIVNHTVPHRVEAKYKAGRVMIKPAPAGSGIIAGSSVRVVLELAGVPNASAKILSKTNNKITNIKAIFKALGMFKPVRVRPTKNTEVIKQLEAPKNIVAEKSAAEKKSTKREIVKKEAAPDQTQDGKEKNKENK